MKNIKTQTVESNFLFQLIYQLVVLVVPLIVAPYVTRIIGDEGLGAYSFVNSIAYYFLVFAMLGIAKHGQRCISSAETEEEVRRQFWSLFLIHVFLSTIAIVLFLAFTLLFVKENQNLFYIHLLYVASGLFDVTWLYYGFENFRGIAIRNLCVKILECVLIFVFVKESNDLWVYTLIVTGGTFLGQIIMIPGAFKSAPWINIGFADLKKHIRPLFVLSLSVIAISLYMMFDKTLLGILSTKENVAYYTYAEKIINIPKTIIAVVPTVFFPRMCHITKKGEGETERRIIDFSFISNCFLGFASLFGLLSVGQELAVYYYGDDFAPSGGAMMAMASLPLIIGIGEIIRTELMIPNNMDKAYTIGIIINAVSNLGISIVLIPCLGLYGAIIGTILGELLGIVYLGIKARGLFSLRDLVKIAIPFCLIGASMYAVIWGISRFTHSSIPVLLIKISCGGFVYCVLSLVYIVAFQKPIWFFLKNRLKHFFKNSRRTNE